jgi:hypothetical protein
MMILSRFWYAVLAIALGAAAFLLFLAAQLYDRAGQRAMEEALANDSSAVEWYLKDDARRRSSALIPIVLNADVRANLAKASGDAKIARDVRDKTRQVLKKAGDEVTDELKFDALWAVDSGGRVVAGDVKAGFEGGSEDWDLGGYPLVADALHGWIRDDAWVWKGRIYRVVARPVEQEQNGEPVGAVIGAKIVDDAFARAISRRTGAAVGFYAESSRVASGAPEGFDASNLDTITQDLKQLDDNKDYLEKGRSRARTIGEHLGVVYARLPGEAWDLGAGYAVGRLAFAVDTPFDFLNKAEPADKEKVPTNALVGVVVVLIALGLVFTYFEHTRPLSTFHSEAQRLAEGKIDVLAPSSFRGAYKKIAADINDGIEKVVVKGGGSRRAADLEQVLGPIPEKPQMSAFSLPGAGGAAPEPRPSQPRGSAPEPRPSQPRGSAPEPKRETPVRAAASRPQAPEVEAFRTPEPPHRPPPPPPKRAAAPVEEEPESIEPLPPSMPPPEPAVATGTPSPVAADDGPHGADAELAEWRKVFEDFLGLKRQCGEPTASLTFEKFKGTLQRNKDALVARHGCSRVKFTVYVKEGKAALKASPVK